MEKTSKGKTEARKRGAPERKRVSSSAHLCISAFGVAVQHLNSFCNNGEVRGTEAPKHQWKISQVEKLIGLPRRDIQRACYSGKGGVAILDPKNSSWGKREYDIDDLAKLFVVKCHRQKGMSLVESASAFRSFEESEKAYSMLDAHVSLMLAKRDELERQIACGMLLRAAAEGKGSFLPLVYECVMRAIASAACLCDAADEPACFALLEYSAAISAEEAETFGNTVRSWIQSGETPCSPTVQSWLKNAVSRISQTGDEVGAASVARVLARVFDHPSIEPAFELWLGPGSFEFMDEMVAAMVLSDE